jgi:hypothetical protein
MPSWPRNTVDKLDPNNEEHQDKAFIEHQIELTAYLQLQVLIDVHFLASDVLTKIDYLDLKAVAERTIRDKLRERQDL